MWVTYERDLHLHLGNTTTNRLECHNQKLKDLTSRTSSLSEMFQDVLRFARTSEAEYNQISFMEEFTTMFTANDGMHGVSEIVAASTQYAASMMVEQLQLAHSVGYVVQVQSGDDKAVVQSHGGRSHSVNLSGDIRKLLLQLSSDVEYALSKCVCCSTPPEATCISGNNDSQPLAERVPDTCARYA